MINNLEYEVVWSVHLDVFVDYGDVELKVNKICNTTFLGDFVVGDVKIKLNGSGNSFTEVWALKVPVTMKFKLKEYYNACAERCGYTIFFSLNIRLIQGFISILFNLYKIFQCTL